MQPETSGDKKIYRIADLQDRWGVCRMTIHREVKRKKLKPFYVAGSVRFTAEEVARYERRAG